MPRTPSSQPLFLGRRCHFTRKGQDFPLCDFLKAQPHLKPFVRSILVDPEEFAPVPLLRLVPNLSRIKFGNPYWHEENSATNTRKLNQSILVCFHPLSAHIQTLCLSDLYLETYLHFFRFLSAFPRIIHLICDNNRINGEGEPRHLEMAKQRLSQRLRLVTVSFRAPVPRNDANLIMNPPGSSSVPHTKTGHSLDHGSTAIRLLASFS